MKQEELAALGLEPALAAKVWALCRAEGKRQRGESAALRGRLAQARQQLAQLQAGQEEGRQWREKYEAFARETAEREKRRAAERAAEAYDFSSQAARAAFVAQLLGADLPLGEDGFDPQELGAFAGRFRAGDPGAFRAPADGWRAVAETPGCLPPPPDRRAQANGALRALLQGRS